jgi:hypothetical protein
MTRKEKCELAIEKGFIYNPETGKVTSKFGRELKGKNNEGYIQIQIMINYKTYKISVHQFAWYWVNKECVEQIDHINGIRDDNRICNLRSVTHQQNHFNMTKAKGFYWVKSRNKWESKIMLNGKSIHLGLFEKEEDARTAYLEAKKQYHII